MAERITGGADPLEGIIALHERAVLYEVLLMLHPTAAIPAIALTAGYELWKHNAKVFADRLIELKIDPPEERIRDQEFLRGLGAAMRRVQRAVSDEKVRSFADMFATYDRGEHFQSIDHFDEYLSILDELSVREFKILIILLRHESSNPLRTGQNSLQRANAIWKSFEEEVEQKVGVKRSQLQAVLTRIQRTGLYETITGTYLNYAGGRGCLTPLFGDFVATLGIGISN